MRADQRSGGSSDFHPPRWLTAVAALALVGGLAALAVAAVQESPPAAGDAKDAKELSGAPAPEKQRKGLRLRVVSNRADLLSGGDALVEVVLPKRGKVPGGLKVTVDDRDVTDAFRVRRKNKRYLGLVTGLRDGRSVLTATANGRPGARLTLTNHPLGGPVFSGEQVQPWLCATEENGLGSPRDRQCNTPPVTQFFYWSVRSGDFMPYDPDNPPPPADMTTATTDQGHTVPFVIRRERGVINRGIYDIAMLYEPGKRWKPWAPQKTWNRKLFWTFGGSCQPYHAQQPPEGRRDPSAFPGVFHELSLSRGFAVASSAMTVGGNNCNSVVAAETVMMVKEHLVETYGPIRYTFGLGGSGGSIQQLQIADAYPGLLDGIIMWATFADLLTTVTETFDCRVLSRYFNVTSPDLWTPASVQAVLGHGSANTCKAWILNFGFPAMFGDPTLGCLTPLRSYRDTDRRGIVRTTTEPDWVYDPDTNPDGVRCTIFDYMDEVFGRRDDGIAARPYDNVGVQYGLDALREGHITAEQFVDLNTKVGSLDLDYRFQDSRTAAGRKVLRAAYRSGQVTSGTQLADIPILDASFFPAHGELHTAFHSRKLGERLVATNGTARNLVAIQAAKEPALFALMDNWLARIKADAEPGTAAQRVVRNKPPQAVVSGSFRGTNPRVAAGAPLRDDVLKCRLKPLRRRDYRGVSFTSEEWGRLRQAFPAGVCDWTRRGVGQTQTQPWLTYAGQGMTRLPPAPGMEPVPPGAS